MKNVENILAAKKKAKEAENNGNIDQDGSDATSQQNSPGKSKGSNKLEKSMKNALKKKLKSQLSQSPAVS